MIVKKPRKVDFVSLKQSMEQQVFSTKILFHKSQDNKERLNEISSRNSKQERELAFANIDYEIFSQDLKIKEELLQEYMERTVMQQLIDNSELEDYKANHKFVFDSAMKLVNDLGVSIKLRDHLKEVLNVNTLSFDEEQKIAFFLALKKEVEVCESYKANEND